MLRCAVWLLVAMCAAAGLSVVPAMAQGRVALVIGNSDYKHTRVLPNPRNDAEAVAALLRQIGFAAGDVILKLDLDYRAMRQEVRAFTAKAAGADMALVYYAGHGIEVAGENYLVPVDANCARRGPRIRGRHAGVRPQRGRRGAQAEACHSRCVPQQSAGRQDGAPRRHRAM